LTEQVSPQDKGRMEGVLVSAKRGGSRYKGPLSVLRGTI
jgi:hypothetical protein